MTFHKNSYLSFLSFFLFALFVSTLLNQYKYYDQLDKARTYHYKDVIFVFSQMNQQCLLKHSETVCFEQFYDALNHYSNRGTIKLYDLEQQILLDKRDESIYDHRLAVTVSHTFSEFKTLQPRIEISKLTSYPNLFTNSINAMFFSLGNYVEDIVHRLIGAEPVIKDMSWLEFGQKIAWPRFYPALPFLFALLTVATYGWWRRKQVEKLNLRLIEELQALQREREELEQSISNLKQALELKDHDSYLLQQSIEILNKRIAKAVDPADIKKLQQEKQALNQQLNVTEQEQQQLKQALLDTENIAKNLQGRIEGYELKAGYTLLGEFVRLWTYFEKQLYRLASQPLQERMADVSGKSKPIKAVELIDDMYNQAIINQDLRDKLHNLRKFRNNIVHGSKDQSTSYDHVTHDLKSHSELLRIAIDKLQAQEAY